MSGEANDRSDAAPARPRRLRIVARNAVLAVLGLVALLTLAALVVPLAVDLNGYKGEISARLKAMTGRDLTIAGSIDLAILPVPMVTVNDIGLGNAAGAAAPNMVELKAVEARVALWPLLGGELLVESLAFVEPIIEFEILADGSTNWLFDTAAVGGEDSEFGERLGSLVVEDGTIVYRDTRRGLIELIENVNVEAAAASLGGPFRARGVLVARGAGFAFEVTMGALAERPIAVGVDLKLASVGASLSFAGSLSSASPGAELTGKLTAKGDSFAGIVTALAPSGATRPEFERGFSIIGRLSGSAVGAVVDDVEIELGGISGTGNLQAAFGDEPRIDVALAFDRVDLDKLVGESPSAAAAEDRADDAEGAPFALPAEVNVTVDLRVDALVLNRSVMREVRIVTTLDQGILTLQHGSALLPGGADFTAFGVLDSVDGAPRFLGQVEGSADNLRALLDWLEVPVPPVAGDRLRTMRLATKLEITPKLVRFAALEISLDGSQLSGGVSVEFRRDPSFTAIVSLDRLDLDSYLLPAAGGAPAAANAVPKGGFIAALAAIDGELKVHVGSLVYRQVPVSALVIDAAIKGGKVKLRRLTADDVAGARGTISGVVEPAALAFDLAYDMESADLRRLLRVLDVTVPVANLGPLSVRGHVKGDVAAVAFDATVAVAGAEAKLVGSVSGIATRPAVDATVKVRGAELERLVRRFGADGVAGSARVGGAYSLVGNVIGDAKRAEVVFELKAIGVHAKLNGTVTDIVDEPAYDIAITANHPDLAALAKIFFDGVELSRRGASEIRLRARATGDAAQARVSILEASIGPTRLNGAVEASWDGARPRLKAEIAAGEIDLDMYVPAAPKAPPDATVSAEPPRPAERWSREPFDLSALNAVDAKVRLAADVVKFRKHRFEAVSLRLTLADGALEIDELAGRLYGAPITLTARLADAKPPTATIEFRLEGADLRALLLDKADGGAVSGRLDLSGKFHTKGESEFELVSALAGEAALDARDGVIQGFDIALLNERLGALDSEAAFVRLSEAALGGGKTRVHGLQARFAAVDGVLRSDNVRAVLDGGQGRAEATVDLPRWQLALDGAFSLADHPNAPLAGIALTGPIDDPRREVRDRELRAYVVRKLLGGGDVNRVAPKTGPKIGMDASATDAALDALGDGIAPRAAPVEATAESANSAPNTGLQPDPRFNNVLKGIIKDLDGSSALP